MGQTDRHTDRQTFFLLLFYQINMGIWFGIVCVRQNLCVYAQKKKKKKKKKCSIGENNRRM